MAVRRHLYAELQIQVDDGTRWEAINRLAQLLVELLRNGRLGTFTGEENRGDEAVFFFESVRLVSAIGKVRELVEELNLLPQSSVVVRADVLPRESDLRLHLSDSFWKDRITEFAKPQPKARGRRPKIYDYYAVPLPDGRFGHLQYIHHDPNRGDLVQVLSAITAEHASCVDELVDAKPLFPPVQTAVTAGILVGGWIWIGNRERRDEFRFPTFRGTNSLWLRKHEPGTYEDWWLWSGGDNWRPIGKLNEEHRKLEYDVGWPPLDLARRIATGENEYELFR